MIDNDRSALSSDARLPSELVRTFASLLIFIHLFALSLVFLTSSSGATPFGSELVARLRSVMAPYLNLIWFNHPYDYHLTYGVPSDYDHSLAIQVMENGQPRGEAILLPPQEVGLGHRRERYQRLAWQIAQMVENPAQEALLPTMVGGQLLKQHSAKQLEFIVNRTYPIRLDLVGLQGLNQKRQVDKVLDATIQYLPGIELPQYSKKGEARDVVPIVKPPAATGGANDRLPGTNPRINPPGAITPGGLLDNPIGVPGSAPLFPASPPAVPSNSNPSDKKS